MDLKKRTAICNISDSNYIFQNVPYYEMEDDNKFYFSLGVST
jgi:hypothetical protein